ncbi:alkaline phosphatase D family protein [Arenibacter sp. F20364]|uniref:alkaline phosphatase D family protein n=1 Tax=Arenibacter sp. F20364 TaxID=2926415 RepID=UPI001FF1ACC2|nr:alkaline phosphatase D family protein [Arenibacter sp. F20364]MCK0190888.1 alkaline phosphatase D family protein [Arenibacter sp. F20364]
MQIVSKLRILFLVITFPAWSQVGNTITHGPILGHISHNSVRIWGRTSTPGPFNIVYQQTEVTSQTPKSVEVNSFRADDTTGWTTLTNLEPDTVYSFYLQVDGDKSKEGSFRTLPDSKDYVNVTHNPEGLFNFKFEYGSCASQNPDNGIGPSLPTYTTMLKEVKDEVNFAVMNGDWLYEEKRDYPLTEWLKANNLKKAEQPKMVTHAPTVVGVWENYKSYLDRAENLAEWHRHVPSYFTFDDHELINDIWGAGTAGRRDRRTVFRDIGTAAWYDYLGWANPTEFDQDIHFGKGKFRKGSDILTDPNVDFTILDLKQMGNLHVLWGTPTAGVDEIALDSVDDGNPNSKVYDIVEIINKHKLRISPAAVANGSGDYSIARKSYSKFTVGNCDFFLLDTRTHREWHDTQNRDQPGLTLLGKDQLQWLKEEMKNSEADFFFLFSSVPFMIPHIGAGGYAMSSNKDESWTVFLDEREKLINFWEELEQPVFVLTGDLHNSFAVKITDHIWEFCAGPHNSVNHRLSDEGNRPKSGLYQFDKREMDIRWSSFVLDDIPRTERMYPHYCVVQINNVFNNPQQLGEKRWVAYEHPQVIFQFYDGRTGEFRYSETVSTKRRKK